jgi:hypothetical protein
MKTTMTKIKSFHRCKSVWEKLNKNHKQEKVSLMQILKSNGIEDAVLALRCFDYKDYCLFNADVAESVLHIFEKKYPKDLRPRNCIQGIRDFKAGKITKEELKSLRDDYVVADVVADDVADVVAYVVADAVADVAVAYAAYDDVADAYAAADVAAVAVAAYARKNQWIKIEALFIKHFK